MTPDRHWLLHCRMTASHRQNQTHSCRLATSLTYLRNPSRRGSTALSSRVTHSQKILELSTRHTKHFPENSYSKHSVRKQTEHHKGLYLGTDVLRLSSNTHRSERSHHETIRGWEGVSDDCLLFHAESNTKSHSRPQLRRLPLPHRA